MEVSTTTIIITIITIIIIIMVGISCRHLPRRRPRRHHLLRPRRIIMGIVGNWVAVIRGLPFAKLWQTALFLSKTSFLTSWPKTDRVKAIIRNLKITPCFAMANIV